MSIEIGTTVYLLDGREVEYVAAAGSRHLVADLYETDLGPWRGQEFVVDAVFSTPPTEKLHAEIAELQEKVRALREQAWEAQSEANNAAKANAQRLAKLSKLAPIKRIEDFIEGRVTHVVVTEEYSTAIKVQPLSDALKIQERDYQRDQRLVCLFGRSNGDLAWRMNRYYDGSGSGWTDLEPFCTEEEAITRAAEMIAERMASEESATYFNCHRWDALVKSAQAIGMEVPPKFQARLDAGTRKAREEAVAKARAELTKAEELLAATGTQP